LNKRRRKVKKFLLAATFVLIGALAFSQERIAVFPFEDMDNVFTRNESAMFYREFSNEFANRSAGKFTVVPRQEIEKLINTEADFQLREFSARAKTAEMGRVLNGSQILSGLIGRVGNNIRITVSLYTYPELEQLPGGATVSVSNKNELFSKIPELVQNMQNGIGDGVVPAGLEFETARGSVTITKYTGNAATVNIPNQIQGLPVTDIGDYAFYNCSNLTNITIPSSVMIIKTYAFSDCSSLTSVIIPSSVTSIQVGVFEGCSSLTSITVDSRNSAYASVDGVLFDKGIRTIIRYPSGKIARTYAIPSSVTSIGNHAFNGCNSLTSVTIPSSVTAIGYFAFFSCSSLTSVTIPSSVMSIGAHAFQACNSLKGITIPSSVTTIEAGTFLHCFNLRSITIPSSVMSIGDGAFQGCTSLTSVTLSRRTQVGTDAFSDLARITYRD
jgi:TolB-like protein